MLRSLIVYVLLIAGACLAAFMILEGKHAVIFGALGTLSLAFIAIITASQYKNSKSPQVGSVRDIAILENSTLSFFEKVASVMVMFSIMTFLVIGCLYMAFEVFQGDSSTAMYYFLISAGALFLMLGLTLECCRSWQLQIKDGHLYTVWGSTIFRAPMPEDFGEFSYSMGDLELKGERYYKGKQQWASDTLRIRASGWSPSS